MTEGDVKTCPHVTQEDAKTSDCVIGMDWGEDVNANPGNPSVYLFGPDHFGSSGLDKPSDSFAYKKSNDDEVVVQPHQAERYEEISCGQVSPDGSQHPCVGRAKFILLAWRSKYPPADVALCRLELNFVKLAECQECRNGIRENSKKWCLPELANNTCVICDMVAVKKAHWSGFYSGTERREAFELKNGRCGELTAAAKSAIDLDEVAEQAWTFFLYVLVIVPVISIVFLYKIHRDELHAFDEGAYGSADLRLSTKLERGDSVPGSPDHMGSSGGTVPNSPEEAAPQKGGRTE